MPGEGDGGEASAELRPQAKRAACRKPRATPLKRARAADLVTDGAGTDVQLGCCLGQAEVAGRCLEGPPAQSGHQ
jgi:hypothetical protein